MSHFVPCFSHIHGKEIVDVAAMAVRRPGASGFHDVSPGEKA
jgi:hypothetical protein